MNNAWWITLDSIIIFVLLAGGFFMFRAFLRKMKPDSTDNRDAG